MKLCDLYLIERKECPKKYRASVAVVQHRDKWLLGLNKCSDDRDDLWSFPAGGVKSNETAQQAAVRETSEETGIKCRAVGEPFELQSKKDVAFVHCRADSKRELKPSSEFVALGWFTKKEMKSLKLYKNVLQVIDRCD